jgi:hypothetical protein
VRFLPAPRHQAQSPRIARMPHGSSKMDKKNPKGSSIFLFNKCSNKAFVAIIRISSHESCRCACAPRSSAISSRARSPAWPTRLPAIIPVSCDAGRRLAGGACAGLTPDSEACAALPLRASSRSEHSRCWAAPGRRLAGGACVGRNWFGSNRLLGLLKKHLQLFEMIALSWPFPRKLEPTCRVGLLHCCNRQFDQDQMLVKSILPFSISTEPLTLNPVSSPRIPHNSIQANIGT